MLKEAMRSKLITNGAIYIFFELLNKGIPFLLLPILTRFLAPGEIGLVANFSAIVSLATVLVSLNLSAVIRVDFFKLSNRAFRATLGACFFILLCSWPITLLVAYFASEYLEETNSLPITWWLAAVLVAGLQFLTTVNTVLWQVEDKAKNYGLYELLSSSTNALLSIFLVVGLGLGATGRLTAITATALFFGCVSLCIIHRRRLFVIQYRPKYIFEALKFGLPLVPHALSSWFRVGIDRFFLTSLVGLSATGTYFAGFQVGMILGILVAAFQRAYIPYLFARLKNISDRNKINLVRFTYIYFVFVMLVAVTIGYGAERFIHILLGEEYREAGEVVFWIALGYAFDGMYLMVVNYIFFIKRTRALSLITTSAGLIHAILSYALIKKHGLIGAAYATTASFALVFVAVWILSARLYPLPWLRALYFHRKYDL